MTSRKKKLRRLAGKFFRGLRILLLFVLFLLVFAAIYFQAIGLPGFLKRPLLARLREQGWEVQFSDMRWHWYRGIVLENATFSRANDLAKFTAEETSLDLNLRQLRQSRLQLDSLAVSNGALTYSHDTNQAPLALSAINTRIRFSKGDRIEMNPFEATFHGAKITIHGSLTNLSALRDLQPSASGASAQQEKLRRFAEVLKQIQFTQPPELKLYLEGDGRDLLNARGSLLLTARGASTPWGEFTGVKFDASVNNRQSTNAFPGIEARLGALAARTRWGDGTALNCRITAAAQSADVNWFNIETSGSINSLQFDRPGENGGLKIDARTAQFRARSKQPLSKDPPTHLEGKVRLLEAGLHWRNTTNTVDALLTEGEVNFAFDSTREMKSGPAWGGWAALEPWTFDWKFDARQIDGSWFRMKRLLCEGSWSAPQVKVTKLNSTFAEGVLSLEGDLDIITRRSRVALKSGFDLHRLNAFLPASGARFLSKLTWQKPPELDASLGLTFAPWTSLAPDWAKDVLPSVTLDGNVAVEKPAYGAIPALALSSSVHYSNQVWTLPNVRLVRAEGEMNLALRLNDRTRSFEARLHGVMDPKSLRGELNEKARQALDLLQLGAAPRLDLELWGRLTEPDSIGGRGRVALTNFAFRGQSFDSMASTLSYSNRFLHCSAFHLEHNGGRVDSPRIEINFQTNRIFFTDVQSTIDPIHVVTCIGPDVVEAIEPYRFAEPPTVLMNGELSMGGIDDADLHFEVEGNRFTWMAFEAERAAGTVHWMGRDLLVTNAQAAAYHGNVAGWAAFDFRPKGKVDYRYDMAFNNIDAQSLLKGLNKTNDLEGLLTGQINIVKADTRGYETWQGVGAIQLRDGLIWKIPIFGIFSPLLDTIAPGVGASRARAASATFTVTNGVGYTDDLEIRASTVRLQYRGTVDYDGRVDAKVEAAILRDAWLIGRVVSLALSPLSKLFEYKVDGSIADPEMKPLYIPKLLLMPLRPFQTLKDLIPDKPDEEKK